MRAMTAKDHYEQFQRIHHAADILGRALGGAAWLRRLARRPIAGQGTETPLRLRDAFDFGWKFTRGDVPAAAARVRRRELAESRSAHDWSIEGRSPRMSQRRTRSLRAHRNRLVPEAFSRPVFLHGPQGIDRVRRRISEQRGLDQRPLPRQAAVRIHQLRYDITPYLNSSGENVAAVKVDNARQPGSRYYSGSGIYRHTWLTAVNPTHVAHWGTYVTTPRVTKEPPRSTSRRACGTRAPASACTCRASARSRRQGCADSGSLPANRPGDEYEFTQELSVAKPNLWSVATVSLQAAQLGSRGDAGGG